MKKKLALALLSALSINYSAYAGNNEPSEVYQYLQQLAVPEKGIGAREAGTKEEQRTADFIAKELEKFGLVVTYQPFVFGKNSLKSTNIIADSNPKASKTIILGAHYDSTGAEKGSLGAIDNGAGVAAMLAIAKKMGSTSNQDINFRYIAFGAEETGLEGSRYYVKQLKASPDELANIKAMINFDTIAGGDIVYVHSAHTKPYRCASKEFPYNSDTSIRNALLSASTKVLGEKDQYTVHPAYPGYPEGVTGSWSDHAPFACAGIPIAYVEATNFTINGEEGYDGYSQTTNPTTWSCFDSKNLSACDRKDEKHWGKIWHTKFDNLETLNQMFPGRIEQQLDQTVAVFDELFSNINKYMK